MNDITKKIVSYVERNLRNEISVKSILDQFIESKSQIYSKFKSDIGIPLSKYIKVRKLMLAYIDLVATDKKNIEIAFEYYFYSHAEFSREFKKMFYVSPNKMREIMRIIDIKKIYYFDDDFHDMDDLKDAKKKNRLIENALNWINQNIENVSSAKDVANKMKMETTHLNHIFKKEIEMSINDYINFRKVMFSTNHLALNNLNVDEIYKSYNYKNHKEYEKEFKKVLVISPQVYRNIIYHLRSEGIELY